ncbi:N-acetylmuramic acid 6-phosphate etherase [Pelomonas sp. UHG3]|jgi:N-acetylmuramic acid 6-phosphate etherase|uniref:N-acetylmuramic acid 6-phosphate etherase n=1 Tax=Roseateles hydrophilus TaxID=2975054 RepID=A0ACC6C9K5_9BURK|nr:N-acetylmuramic acid 6-phosphate etherase [Pelomonas sp. UHG3]MCY4744969.1 N-acetylmuramic acid 6-phosphate etherase [Pelomonas sp. UHG3]
MLNTETPSNRHPDLDTYATPALLDAFITDQTAAVAAVKAAAPQLAAAVDAALPRIRAGGRLLYAGAGTSGRLGVLDSVELYPTFSWPRERAVAVMAGGAGAMFVAVEGAEDDRAQGAADLAALNPGPNDVALLLAASGGTPYVLGAIEAARAAGALTIAFANNPDAPVTQQAEIGITLDTGPEVISGSTRLKAGTSQKIALNTFSSALMVKLNKVYGNLMVDLKATNAKLVKRALALTVRASGASEAQAQAALAQCDHHVKTALVMLKRGVSASDARALLDAADGSVSRALGA